MNELRNWNDIDFDNLPDPEDMWTQYGDFALIGLYTAVDSIYLKISAAVTDMAANSQFVIQGVIDREAMLEQWLNSARDYLPAWHGDYCRMLEQIIKEAHS